MSHSNVGAETRSSERKSTVTDIIGYLLLLVILVLGIWGMVYWRKVFPDVMGHYGKWVIGGALIIAAEVLAANAYARFQRWYLKLPPP